MKPLLGRELTVAFDVDGVLRNLVGFTMMSRFLHLWWWKGLLMCRNFGFGFWRNVWC